MAVAAGGALLLGGAGSLAYWTDSETEGSQTVVAGQLDLSAPDCGTGWSDGGDAVTLSSFRIVPGDTLTKSCTFTVSAAGDNLQTKLTFVKPALDASTLAGELTYGATYKLNAATPANLAAYDNAVPTIVNLKDGDEIVVAFQVSLGAGADNDSNSGAEFTTGDTGLVAGELTAVLSQLTLTVDQVAG